MFFTAAVPDELMRPEEQWMSAPVKIEWVTFHTAG